MWTHRSRYWVGASFTLLWTHCSRDWVFWSLYGVRILPEAWVLFTLWCENKHCSRGWVLFTLWCDNTALGAGCLFTPWFDYTAPGAGCPVYTVVWVHCTKDCVPCSHCGVSALPEAGCCSHCGVSIAAGARCSAHTVVWLPCSRGWMRLYWNQGKSSAAFALYLFPHILCVHLQRLNIQSWSPVQDRNAVQNFLGGDWNTCGF